MDEDKRLLDFLKEYSTIVIFALGVFGTLFTFVIQAISTVFEIGRYNALGIPLYFMEQEYTKANVFRVIFMAISIVVAIIIAVLLISHSRQTKAYLRYKQQFHTSKVPLRKKLLTFINSAIFTLVPLCLVNYVSMRLFPSSKSGVMIVQQILLLYYEVLFAKMAVIAIENCRKEKYRKYEPEPFEPFDEKDQEQEISEDKRKDLEDAMLHHEAVLSYEETRIIVGLVLGGCLAFAAAYVFGKASAGETICQIVQMQSRSMVVITTYQDNYILSPIEIKSQDGEKTVLCIYNTYQYIQPIDELPYEIRKFDEVQLMNTK